MEDDKKWNLDGRLCVHTTNIIDRPIDNLSEYLSVIMDIENNHNLHKQAPLWFRGLTSFKHGLHPGIYREANKNILSQEDSIINEYFLLSNNFISREAQDGWDWIALMQHYGMPTRLLDWSESCLVALYFAVKYPSDDFPCVWVMSPLGLNKTSIKDESIMLATDEKLFDWLPTSLHFTNTNNKKKNKSKKIINRGKKPIAVYIRYTNSRILAQTGAFTLHGSYSKPLDDFFIEHKFTAFRKIILKPKKTTMKMEDYRKKLLEELEIAGVHELSLFPELSSVANFLKIRRV